MNADYSGISTQELLKKCESLSSDLETNNDQMKGVDIMNEVIAIATTILERKEPDVYPKIRSHMYLAGAERNLALEETDSTKKNYLNDVAFEHFKSATNTTLESENNYIAFKTLPWSLTFLTNYLATEPESESSISLLEMVMKALAETVTQYKEECRESLDDLLNCQILTESLQEVENPDDRKVLITDLLEKTLRIKRIFLLYEEKDFYLQANELFHRLEGLLEQGDSLDQKRTYYFIDSVNQQQGPFTLDEIENQAIGARTLVWFNGADGWIVASEVPELTAFLPPAPPPDEIPGDERPPPPPPDV